ncbi:MAG: hypothetical protein AB1726_01770, partial [Planctomycetota bacterium]
GARPARGAARERGGRAEGEEGSARRGSRRAAKPAPEKRKLPLGGLIGFGALLVIVAGGWLLRDLLFGGNEKDEGGPAAGGTPAAEAAPAAETPAGGEAVAPAAGASETPAAAGPAETTPAAETSPAGAGEKPKEVADPDSVDLSALPEFGPTMGCTPEKFREMQELMATWMDLDQGAAGNRAGRALQEEGRIAVPVIINFMKTIDLGTEYGFRQGDMCQKTLQHICYERNFGWKYPPPEFRANPDPETVWYDKEVIRKWAVSWQQADQSIEAWIKMCDIEKKKPEDATRLRKEFGEGAPGAAPTKKDDEGIDLDID